MASPVAADALLFFAAKGAETMPLSTPFPVGLRERNRHFCTDRWLALASREILTKLKRQAEKKNKTHLNAAFEKGPNKKTISDLAEKNPSELFRLNTCSSYLCGVEHCFFVVLLRSMIFAGADAELGIRVCERFFK